MRYSMTPDTPVEIPLSKTKIVLSLLGALLFVCMGIWLLLKNIEVDRILIALMGLLAVLFFGAIAVTSLKKCLAKEAGLVINNKGLIDRSSGASAGFVPWSDIAQIQSTVVMNQKFLLVFLHHPTDYIVRQSNYLKRKIMQWNYQQYGAPIAISAKALSVDFIALENLLIQKLKQYQS